MLSTNLMMTLDLKLWRVWMLWKIIISLITSQEIVVDKKKLCSRNTNETMKSMINHINLTDDEFISQSVTESLTNFDHCQIIKTYSGNMDVTSMVHVLNSNQKIESLDCRSRHNYLTALDILLKKRGSCDVELGKTPYNNPINRYPVYELLSNEKVFSNTSKCHDLPDTEIIIELICSHQYHTTTFHKIKDCWLVNMPLVEFATILIQRKQKVRVIVPNEYVDYFNALYSTLKTEDKRNYHVITFHNKESCYRIPEKTYVLFETRIHYPMSNSSIHQYSRTSYELFQKHFITYSINEYMKLGHIETSNPVDYFKQNGAVKVIGTQHPILLIIYRKGGREFTMKPNEMKYYFETFLSPTIITIQFYYGTESLAETIVKFSTADFVFGYHGAGFVNMLFSPKKLVAIETTLFLNRTEGRMWRSNTGLTNLKNDMKWKFHIVEFKNDLAPPTTMSYSQQDHFYQYTKFVNLTSVDITDVTKIILANL